MTTTAAADLVGGHDHQQEKAPEGAPAATAVAGDDRLNTAGFLSLILVVQIAWLAALGYAAWFLFA